MSHTEAIAELVSGAGSQFEAKLVQSFIDGHVGAGTSGFASQELDLGIDTLSIESVM
jgi:HD-GYP domain-containing protein (c-di-GMP phosphodiesterase class II)